VIYIAWFHWQDAELKHWQAFIGSKNALRADKGKLGIIFSEDEKIVSCRMIAIERFEDRTDCSSGERSGFEKVYLESPVIVAQ
jgi:hypothetical protein